MVCMANKKKLALRKLYFHFLYIESDMIVVTVFHSILNQMEIHLVQNRKESCHHDHIPFEVKGKENIDFSVCHGRGGIFSAPKLEP